ncbi:hypothetical protein H4Q26_015740 [Puccinia striiformis f. sp. tritici PST-130]|nr:hypothetical protein H4Q26_015740 [Puccinia striiformis f. sp. tritici PST-130]
MAEAYGQDSPYKAVKIVLWIKPNDEPTSFSMKPIATLTPAPPAASALNVYPQRRAFSRPPREGSDRVKN